MEQRYLYLDLRREITAELQRETGAIVVSAVVDQVLVYVASSQKESADSLLPVFLLSFLWASC